MPVPHGDQVTTALADAYSASGAGWQVGPGRIYDRLADTLVARSPVPLRHRTTVDVGAGTGAAVRAAARAGASAVVAVDVAVGMLRHLHEARSTAAVGDGIALPFRGGSFGAAVAAFSLNHLPDPASALREMARVTQPGGPLLASAYAADDVHPVRDAVQAALAARGWTPPPWYEAVRRDATPRMATVDAVLEVAAAAGLVADAAHLEVGFPDLRADDLVAWRLGMAQHAPFVASLPPAQRAAVAADAVARLGPDAPPLVRRVIVLCAVSGRAPG